MPRQSRDSQPGHRAQVAWHHIPMSDNVLCVVLSSNAASLAKLVAETQAMFLRHCMPLISRIAAETQADNPAIINTQLPSPRALNSSCQPTILQLLAETDHCPGQERSIMGTACA